ncbi:hypothetical protein [Solidesulfovibrio sp.]
MNFKEQLAADLAGTFLRSDEFADTITFQGQSVTAVLAQDSAEALDEWRRRIQEPPGVGVRLLTVCLAVGAVEPVYPQEVLTIDGEAWSVLTTTAEAGLLTMHLYRHES